jgi:N-formylglutamate amidohydrolase
MKRITIVSLAFILCAFTLSAMQRESQNQIQRENYVIFQRGDLPIIITAPHGGKIKIPEIPDRQNGTTVWDGYSLELAQLVSDELFKLIGARPYIVLAEFSRKNIDANRPPSKAYENLNAKKYYDFYHGIINEFIHEIKIKFPRAILLDFHAQGKNDQIVYRGTQDCTTVASLLKKFGQKALSGPKSILGNLENRGYKIFPNQNQQQKAEDSAYNGGYTVGHYGSHRAQGIDAIQLEFGWDYRNPATNLPVAHDIAQSIAQFYGSYLVE